MIEKKRKPPLIITWDTETDKNTDETDQATIITPYLIIWWCDNKFYYSIDKENHRGFFKFLEEKAKHYKLELWVYNAMYDLPVIIKDYLIHLYPKYKIKYQVSEKKKFISFKYISKKLSFTVYDAAIWAPTMSLNDWFKALGLPEKVEGFDYDKWGVTVNGGYFEYKDSKGNHKKANIRQELKYGRRDVEGLYHVVKHQLESKEFLSKSCGVKYSNRLNAPSAPSFSKRILNQKFLIESTIRRRKFINFDNTFRPVIYNRQLYREMLLGSCGGYTSCNKEILKFHSPEGLIHSYDYNSYYPAIMAYGVPLGEISLINKWNRSITWYRIKVTYCRWIEELSYLSTPPTPERWNISKDCVFLLKKYYDEIIEYVETDIEIKDTYYQELKTPLTSFIKNLYKQKVNLGNLPEDTEEQKKLKKFKVNNVKLMLNSLFGKLGEKTYTKDTYYDSHLMDFVSDNLIIDDAFEWRYVLAGVYVAQAGRANLIKDMIKEHYNGNKILYLDTDSIKMHVNNPPLFKTHPTKLGSFKCENWSKTEGFTHWFCTGKIKKYLMYNEQNYRAKNGLQLKLSGVQGKIKSLIHQYATLDILNTLFEPGNNVMIIGGKNDKRRNKYGQFVISGGDICLNGNAKAVTHKLTWNNKDKTWTLKKTT